MHVDIRYSADWCRLNRLAVFAGPVRSDGQLAYGTRRPSANEHSVRCTYEFVIFQRRRKFNGPDRRGTLSAACPARGFSPLFERLRSIRNKNCRKHSARMAADWRLHLWYDSRSPGDWGYQRQKSIRSDSCRISKPFSQTPKTC